MFSPGFEISLYTPDAGSRHPVQVRLIREAAELKRTIDDCQPSQIRALAEHRLQVLEQVLSWFEE